MTDKLFLLLLLSLLCVKSQQIAYFNFTDVTGGIFTFSTSDPLVIQHAQVSFLSYIFAASDSCL